MLVLNYEKSKRNCLSVDDLPHSFTGFEIIPVTLEFKLYRETSTYLYSCDSMEKSTRERLNSAPKIFIMFCSISSLPSVRTSSTLFLSSWHNKSIVYSYEFPCW